MINYLLGYNLLFSYVAEIGFHVIALCNSVNNFSFTSCFIRVFLYNVYSMRYSKYETSVFVILFHLWQTIHNKFSYERNDLTVFFNCLHTFSKLCLLFSKLYTQIQELHTQNASQLLQNEALHSKYHKHISKASICKHLCHNINSC